MTLSTDANARTDSPSPLPSPGGRGRKVLALLKLVLFLIVLGCVGWRLAEQLRRVSWEEVPFRPLPLVAAMIAALGISAMQLLMFRTLLGTYGYTLPWKVTLGAAWVPPLGKYVPGKIASIAGAVYLQRRHGVPGAVAVSVALMLDGLAVVAGLIVSVPLLVWHGAIRAQLPTAWVWCIVIVVAGLVLLHPKIFVATLNLLLHALRRPPLSIVPSIGHYLLPAVAAFGQWIFAGLALWLMSRAITDRAEVRMIPLFISIAALAMTVSYLTLFAPGGLGVREGIYSLALLPLIGPESAIVIVLLRLVQTLIEVALAAIGFALLRASGGVPARDSGHLGI